MVFSAPKVKKMIKKQIASSLYAHFYDSRKLNVWDTAQACDYMIAKGEVTSRRTGERRLVELSLVPKELNSDIILDEFNRPPNRIVMNWAVQNARKKRTKVMYAQIYELTTGQLSLHMNDARGARFWTALSELSDTSIMAAIERLCTYISGTILFLPHGLLTKFVRNTKNSEKLIFFHEAYKPVLSENLTLVSSAKSLVSHSPHLKKLEAESIFILREAIAEARNPVMMYSIGKDSGVMLHLARKAFYPATPPFPLLHIDTQWKFQEMYLFREFVSKQSGMELLVFTNPEAIEKNINPFDHGSALHTSIAKTEGLKLALDHYKFDVIFGGARRDEEKSRAKERIFSFRNASHSWDPKNQRPELWSLFNTRKSDNESIRVFPLSNWTELDIWQYIYQENIPVVPLYFAKPRPVVVRSDMIMMIDDDRCRILSGEKIQIKKVRFRTLGCYPLTGAVESEAETLEDILLEVIQARQSERQGRKIDSDNSSSMEKKKQEGYF